MERRPNSQGPPLDLSVSPVGRPAGGGQVKPFYIFSHPLALLAFNTPLWLRKIWRHRCRLFFVFYDVFPTGIGGVTGPRQLIRRLIVYSQIRRMRSQANGLGQSRTRVALETLCAVFIPDVRSAQTSTHILKSQENNGPLIEKNAQCSGMVFLYLTLMAMRFFWIFAMVFRPFLHFPP